MPARGQLAHTGRDGKLSPLRDARHRSAQGPVAVDTSGHRRRAGARLPRLPAGPPRLDRPGGGVPGVRVEAPAEDARGSGLPGLRPPVERRDLQARVTAGPAPAGAPGGKGGSTGEGPDAVVRALLVNTRRTGDQCMWLWACSSSSSSGRSTTSTSVVMIIPAIEPAFCSAERVTLSGSMTPAFCRSS